MASEERCFTFVWKLKNVSNCIQMREEEISSPAFVVDAIERTKWRLQLYLRTGWDAKDIGYSLWRQKDSRGNDEVRIKFELNFIGIDGSNLTNKRVFGATFHKGGASYFHFHAIEDVFVTRKSIFLPNDTLTLRCRIWKRVGVMTEDVKCTALTCIGGEKRTIDWDVKNFSSLELEKKLNMQVKSLQNHLPLMSVDLSLIRDLYTERIQFELFLRDQTIKIASLRLFLINDSGNKVMLKQNEIWFDPSTPSTQLKFTLTKNNLLGKKDVHLPNDTLSLVWEWGFSRLVVSEEPEEDEHGCICSGIEVSDVLDISDCQKSLLNDFADDAKCLYDERFLSDVKLETKTASFPAHKFMLSMSSSVFKAMFSSNMKEKINDCIHIEDLDDDSVSRMLHFIYTRSVEVLTWERAMNLYAAADKYAILSLRKICSSILKKNLSPERACEVLLLADSYDDTELKSDVQGYIVKNFKQITKSEEWKALMRTNSDLASETLS